MKLLLLLLISFSAHAGFFTHHVKESIEINEERRPYYHKLTDGKSEKAFKTLILLEKLILPSAWAYDIRAKYFQRRGVPVLQDEFVPMNRAPDFDPERRKYPQNEIADVPWKKYRRELRKLVSQRDRDALLAKSLSIIEEFKSQPEYWCLTRHLVESVYRVAWFLPQRIKEAKEKNTRSPEQLLWEIMDYHLHGFPKFVKVDKQSASIQKDGIPLLCSELPDLLSDLK